MSEYRILLAAVVFLSVTPTSVADISAQMDACNDCHGDNGVSQWSDVPTIAGMAEFVQADALFVFQEEGRPCADSQYRQGDTSRPSASMCTVVAELSEDDIEAIAAAYAEIPYAKASQDFDADLASAGESIHKQHCDRCHSDAGMNPDDEAGMLGGQWMGYLRSTFEEYASGDRDQMDKMKQKMDLLSVDDVEALLHYYGSQQ